MIGNNYLQLLFEYPDEDTGLNQLLEFLKSKDNKLIVSLRNESIDIDLCTNEEIVYLTKISALIDYYLQIHSIEVPNWLRDKRLMFSKPYYHSKRISDFEKFKLQYTNPSPFKSAKCFF